MKMVRFSVVVVGEVVVVDLAVVVGVNDEVVFIDVPYPVAHARSKKIAMPLPSAVAHAITDAAVAQRYYNIVVVVGAIAVVAFLDIVVVVGVTNDIVFIDVKDPVSHANTKRIAEPLPSAVTHAITDAAVAQRYYNRCCSSCGSVGSCCCYWVSRAVDLRIVLATRR